jgi:hypothetical protein
MNAEPSLAIASGVSGVVISRNRIIVRSLVKSGSKSKAGDFVVR